MISGGSKINYNLSSDSDNDGEKRHHGSTDHIRFRSPN